MKTQTLLIPATGASFMPGDGLSTTVARRGIATPSAWTLTGVTVGASTWSIGDLILHTGTGAWGIATNAGSGATGITVATWWAPRTGRPLYLPSGTGSNSVHIYPAGYLGSARATILRNVLVLGTLTSLTVYDCTGSAIAAFTATGEYDGIDLTIHGPWYVTTVGSGLSGAISFETLSGVHTQPLTGVSGGA